MVYFLALAVMMEGRYFRWQISQDLIWRSNDCTMSVRKSRLRLLLPWMEPSVSRVKWKPYPSSPSPLIISVCGVSKWPVNSSRPFSAVALSSFQPSVDILWYSFSFPASTNTHKSSHTPCTHTSAERTWLLCPPLTPDCWPLMLFRGTLGMCCHMGVFASEWGS